MKPLNRFRNGTKVPRNLYLNNRDIGRIDSTELAQAVVEVLNAAEQYVEELSVNGVALRHTCDCLENAVDKLRELD